MKLDRPRDSALTAITAADDSLRQNILGADLPTLLATVYYLTGDPLVLRPEWKPKLEFGIAVSGLQAEEEQKARAYCFDRLVAFRDFGLSAPQAPTTTMLRMWLAGSWGRGASHSSNSRSKRWSPAITIRGGLAGRNQSSRKTGRFQSASSEQARADC